MLLIILLVMFVVVLMVWLLALLGAIPGSPTYSPWLAFFGVLILGIVVFLVGSGTATLPR
ncbi:MAG TPA: hypothetical protein VKE98_17240 [Gemmataceae bacterium]|nr:hypothetical protein [Gemmataceae bacterium]